MARGPCFERYFVFCFLYKGSLGPCGISLSIWTYIVLIFNLIFLALAIALGIHYEMYFMILYYTVFAIFPLLLLFGRLARWWSLYKIYIVGSAFLSQVSMFIFGVYWIIIGASKGPFINNIDSNWRWSPIPYAMESSTEIIVFDDFIVLGRYTFILCILCEAMTLLQLGNMIYMIYGGAEPTIVSCGSYRFDESLDTKERCAILNQLHSNSSAADEVKCKPEFSAQFKSVNLEWGYYCAKNKLVKQSISIQMVGVIIGSAVFGQLSDRYGRKPTLIVALFCCLIMMMINGLSTNLFMFTVTRFLINIFNGGCIAIQLVFTVENLPKKDRFWITNLIPWSPNMALFAIVAYLANEWRTLIHVSAALSLPGVALILHLFYTVAMARYTIAIAFSTFRYVLNLVSALADVRIKWLGRKLIHAVSEIYIALGFILYIAIYLLGLHHEYRTVLAIIILTIISQTTLIYTTNGILSSELFPTGVRNTSFSFGQILSRVGVVIAPQIFFLSDIWTPLPYALILKQKGLSMVDRMPAKTDSWLHQRRSAAAKRRTTIGAEELLPVADVEGNPVIMS
ncbi:MFS domain-containing protein [Aphelenchoides besseyi]|nr:MFS domain-containing protein [Aphelenchoides besseyi]